MAFKILHFLAILLVAVFVQGSSLNGRCESDIHCGAIDSYCNNGTCVCKEHFAYHGDACIQVVDPRLGCMHNPECHTVLGNRSICKDASCACLPYHHLHNNMCIKNRGLNERCDEDYQCYWGQDMIDKMSCISGECSCKPGFRPHHPRKCESGANSAAAVSGITLLMITLLNRLF
ncbi:hypothetical protein ILUMI_26410 [Ignelater luminosus]|uniref:EB domain-containing protein n=1 Tax=Ignelater luminosus TaxID=2038154 RepID=A0A8K0C6K6_IGNLU|nr:hypothetical protein ILUMI_26410 [Ignelater luminosus]